MDFCQFNFRLLRAHMHHTPTHARWSCGKIFVLSSKRTKRTKFRTDEKNPLYGTNFQVLLQLYGFHVNVATLSKCLCAVMWF